MTGLFSVPARQLPSPPCMVKRLFLLMHAAPKYTASFFPPSASEQSPAIVLGNFHSFFLPSSQFMVFGPAVPPAHHDFPKNKGLQSHLILVFFRFFPLISLFLFVCAGYVTALPPLCLRGQCVTTTLSLYLPVFRRGLNFLPLLPPEAFLMRGAEHVFGSPQRVRDTPLLSCPSNHQVPFH